ncbi:MAG: hypothetical protein GYA24_13820 [Candidatus Lokiarchaeota archaeon]|nr:hypothetical protein [Candidatus Lokiarchaeota archaeon]
MGKLVYTLVSSAYFVDEKWGYGSPHHGILKMGDIAHKPRDFNGKAGFTIPVTWLVTPKSALIERELLTSFNATFKDQVGYMLSMNNHAMNRHADLMKPERKKDLEAHVSREIAEIKEILPWADIQVVGTGYRSNSLVQVLYDLNILGMWGSCPFQIGTDGITDFGAPWGQWYVNSQNFKSPKKYLGKVISMEWTSRDLNKSFHYAQPEAYSTDPNDAESEFKCTDTNVEYWKALLAQYMRNLDINEYIFFHQHQEAHEMEATPTCVPFMQSGQGRVDFTARMLDLFLDHVVAQKNIMILDANAALRLFHQAYKGNQPEQYMYFEDIPIYQLNQAYKRHVENKPSRPKHVYLSFNEAFYNKIDAFVSQDNWRLQVPPWKDSFFYYDSECMLVFDKPGQAPAWICNYMDESRAFDDELMLSEEVIPSHLVEQQVSDAKGEMIDVAIAVNSHKPMPYGIALWGKDFDMTSTEVIRSATAVHTRVINDGLLFIRFNVNQGQNEVELRISHALQPSKHT